MIGPAAVSGACFATDFVTGADDMTELCFPANIARAREVSIKRIAVAVVTLFMTVAAPLLPKRVWFEPPKAAPISAPLLLWIRITKIRNKHTIMCRTSIAVYINLLYPETIFLLHL